MRETWRELAALFSFFTRPAPVAAMALGVALLPHLGWSILVMAGGRIVDDGPFCELAARAGVIRDLYETQRRRTGRW